MPDSSVVKMQCKSKSRRTLRKRIAKPKRYCDEWKNSGRSQKKKKNRNQKQLPPNQALVCKHLRETLDNTFCSGHSQTQDCEEFYDDVARFLEQTIFKKAGGSNNAVYDKLQNKTHEFVVQQKNTTCKIGCVRGSACGSLYMKASCFKPLVEMNLEPQVSFNARFV